MRQLLERVLVVCFGLWAAPAHALDADDDVPIAFVLLAEPVFPEVDALVAEAARLGVPLTPVPAQEGARNLAFAIGGGGVVVLMLKPAAAPDAPRLLPGPLSPSPEALAASTAHLIVAPVGLPGEALTRDLLVTRVVLAILHTTPAIAVISGECASTVNATSYQTLVERAGQDTPPVEALVDVTLTAESDRQYAALTHGLHRYGAEEFLVRGRDAKEVVLLIYQMARWTLSHRDQRLPDGVDVGRTPREHLRVRRVPSPIGAGADVITLDL